MKQCDYKLINNWRQQGLKQIQLKIKLYTKVNEHRRKIQILKYLQRIVDTHIHMCIVHVHVQEHRPVYKHMHV